MNNLILIVFSPLHIIKQQLNNNNNYILLFHHKLDIIKY